MTDLIEHVCTREGGNIHYWLNGADVTRPCLVFLHGAAMNHQMFAAQYPHFTGRYRILTWDMPMHGVSRPFAPPTMQQMAQDLEHIAQQQQLDDIHIVGQSMGGMVGQYWAHLAPSRIASLTLIDSIPLNPRYRSTWDTWALKTLPTLTKWGFKPQAAAKIAARIARTPAAQAYVSEQLSQLSKAELVCIMTALVQGMLAAPQTLTNKLPVQLLVGQFDQMGKVQAYNRAYHRLENVPLHLLTGAGHNANMDAAPECNQILLSWLESHETS